MIGSLTQGHGSPMVASATLLGRVGWVDFEDRSASFFRFARELVKELRPRRITDAFCQTVIVKHLLHVQILNTDGSKVIDNPSTVLMGKILASPSSSFMHTSNHLSMPAPLFRPFCQVCVFPLHFCQSFFFGAEEARVGNFLSGGEGCKRLESNINTDSQSVVFQSLWIGDDRKRDEPFSGCGSMDGTGLDRAFDCSMVDQFDRSNFREAHTVVMSDAEATLRIGHALIATISLKARIARGLSRLAASEKRGEGQINTHRDILQDLGMNLGERGPLFFENRIRLLLLEARERNPIALIGGLAHFQQLIIQDATLFKMGVKRSLLFFCRIDPVPIVFQHRPILHVNGMAVKEIPMGPIPSYHQEERPILPVHPRFENAGLSGPSR
jgi:hypothetical protein